MKKILLTVIISATIGIVHAQNVNIPDAIFKAVLVGNSAINTNGDTEIQVGEAAAFGGTIFCASLGINDLTGIEAFTALTILNCSSNLITSLDVSQNTALTSLNCSGDGYAQGQITNLDVSLNTALTEFYCFENQLDSLNVSQNSALTTLWCYENDLDSLNVSQNPALTTLWCSNNQLTSLDVSQNTSLGDLNCAFNQLTYLDVANGNNTNLNNFYANNNPNLFCVDVDNVAWSTNNWTNISAQTYFSTNCQAPPTTYVPDNNFEAYLEANGMGNGTPGDQYVTTANINTVTSLTIVANGNIADLTGISEFSSLEYLNCSGNMLNSLDVSQNENLIELDCSGNQLQNIYLNDTIAILTCYANSLVSLDLGTLQNLNFVNCHNNQLTSLNVDSCLDLTYLLCNNNNLTSLDVSTTSLDQLDCSNNLITNINLNDSLRILECNDNLLQTLDVSNLFKLSSAFCFQNNLTTFYCDSATNLKLLSLSNNQLSSVDFSTNFSLEDISIFSNQLLSLDISNNINLNFLVCTDNSLEYLDLRNGNNINMLINTTLNPNLSCISVDDTTLANANWTISNGNIDQQHYFSTNCGSTSIEEQNQDNHQIHKIVDVLGRETKGTKNAVLFYIYNDGTVEKKIIIE